MRENWILKHRKGDFISEGKRLGISPILLRLLYNKDIKEDEQIKEYFKINRERIFSYTGLPDIAPAADLLLSYIRNSDNHIRIIGDYDVDGTISTYILLKTIEILNPQLKTDYALPHRQTDGYGLNTRLIDEAKQDGVNLIVTCDNGISAVGQIAYTKSLGMEVIVTDHHEPPFIEENGIKVYETPCCLKVDPKLDNNKYPFTDICGAVVAFKLMCAVYEKVGIQPETLREYIPFLALATVCDVMPIINENRDILKVGLPMLTNTSNIGLKALKKAQQIQDKEVTTYTLGFILGPCINAAGRLETAEMALDLLLCEDTEKADEIAEKLKELNDGRKEMTEDMVKRALGIADSEGYKDQKVLVIYLHDCHESIAGIVAGKVREATGKPCLIVTQSEDGLKGSGRSIETYDMFEHLTEVKHLFTKMGGHKQAAGFSLKEKNLEPLRDELNARCGLSDEDIIPRVVIDMEIPFDHINLRLAEELAALEPFGNGNSKPLFVQRDIEVTNTKICGKNKNVCQVILYDKQNETELKGVLFNDIDRFITLCEEKGVLDLCFNIEVNEWNNNRNVQLVIKHFRSTNSAIE